MRVVMEVHCRGEHSHGSLIRVSNQYRVLLIGVFERIAARGVTTE